jgi:hypothetical protein
MPWFFVIRTEVVSGGPSAASARGVRTTLAAPAIDNMASKRRRVWVMGIGVLSPENRHCRA